MTLLRLLLLVLVVNGVMPLMGAGASTQWSHSTIDLGPGEDDHGCDSPCSCCLVEVETAAIRTEHAILLPATAYAFSPDGRPFDGDYVRHPFRPPMTA